MIVSVALQESILTFFHVSSYFFSSYFADYPALSATRPFIVILIAVWRNRKVLIATRPSTHSSNEFRSSRAEYTVMMSTESPDSEHSNNERIVIAEPLGLGVNFADPHSRLAPLYLGAADVLGILMLTGIVVYVSFFPLWHTDLWGHVLSGEWILEHGELPEHEPFTPYADPNAPAPRTQWLTQVAYASLLRLGNVGAARDSDPEQSLARGVESIRSFHLLVCTGLFVFLWLACRRVSGSAGWANVALLLLFLGLGKPLEVQRPQQLGMLCFAILIFILSRAEPSRGSLAGLPALFAVWANLHGTFVAGLAFSFLTTFAQLARERAQPNSTWRKALRDRASKRLLTAFGFSCAAVALLNPSGPRLYLDVLTFAGRQNIRDLDEWQPLAFHAGPGGHWAFLASWAAVLCVWGLGRCAGSFRLLGALPFGVWPLFQERALLWWLMLAPWLIASFGPRCAERIALLKRLPAGTPCFRKTILATAVVLLALLWFPPIQWIIKGAPPPLEKTLSAATPWRLGLELQARPDQRGRWLKAFNDAVRAYPERHFQGAIFCSESEGDYLLRVAPTESPVLVYTHAHFFTPEYWRQCMDVKNARGAWRDWLAQRRANLIVIEPDYYDKLANELRTDAEWQVVLDEGSLLGRRQRGNRLFIAVRRLPL